MKGCEITVEGLSAHRAVDKLRLNGITVYAARRTQKNEVVVSLSGKERKKAFAILRGSCYNVKKVRYLGLERVKYACIRAMGILIGAAVCLPAIAFLQGRVLKIEVAGSGSYLHREVKDILSSEGIKPFSAAPKKTSALSARILSLPRVEFCSVKTRGGVLTVTVEVSDTLSPTPHAPLVAPVGGRVEQLFAVRGTPLVSVGDEVRKGDVLVGDYALLNERKEYVVVIARARIAYPVKQVYALTEEQARAQALLDFGELSTLTATQTEEGWLFEGTGRTEVCMNLT